MITKKKTHKPRKQNDELLKGAFEENFVDFLRFLYPDADEIFDLSKDIEFMDKELLSIIPNRERQKGKRVADLLAKVYMKDGSHKYILLNIEIEGGNDAEFAGRIYEYNYRIWDRHRISVATIAVYTGGHNQPRPSEYRREVLDTSLYFKYRAYHILDHTEDELLAMNNIFALLVLACQKALLEDKISEDELNEDRSTIARVLIKSGKYDHDRIIRFFVFLKNFLYVNNKELNRIFDEEIIKLSGGTIDMGVIEVVKKQERQLGLKQGVKQKSSEVVENLIVKLGLSDEQIMDIAEVSLDFVKKVRASLSKKK